MIFIVIHFTDKAHIFITRITFIKFIVVCITFIILTADFTYYLA